MYTGKKTVILKELKDHPYRFPYKLTRNVYEDENNKKAETGFYK